jgi:hypothetical protein
MLSIAGLTPTPQTDIFQLISSSLFGLVTSVFSVSFLLVGAPYHSEYLDGVTDTVEVLEDEELREAKDLKIPDYNTVSDI